ncbi:SDR family oxidoreductase [Rugosimonospora africana]|uniref:Short-chain dehydrogenase/reductase n=1 Tax=Rugosimonospora africana TaxID=556532 RepID=A0A8J3QVK8_9ACTN|nr:SDR family oxidoreductase [Rugosimonospora africana]GIH17281.1 short-chain dehydrogenase/reductase [Rugosimonospora africana]
MTTKTWFITGAGSGLGYHLTSLLLERGDRVAATARRPGALDELTDRYGPQLWTTSLDVTDAPAVRRAVDGAWARFGRVDVVVSNAGVGLLGAAEEASDEQLAHQLAVNLVGPIQVARAVIPHLRAQGGGRIVQLSSSGGQVPDPGMSLYNATKFGVEGFYESLALELAPFGIETTLVEPGGSRTGFNRNLMLAPPIDAYRDTVVGQVRGLLTGADPEFLSRAIAGDPAKIARAIVDSTGVSPAPKRLVLGGGAYEQITAALRDRLAALEAQRELAYSTDADDARRS